MGGNFEDAINVEMVKSKVNKLMDLEAEQKKFYEDAMVEFFNDMSLAWASDSAVDQYNFLSDLVGDHIIAIIIGNNESINAIITTANTWLSALDSEDGTPETIDITFGEFHVNKPDIATFKAQLENGNTGIDPDAVNAIYEIFHSKCKMHLAAWDIFSTMDFGIVDKGDTIKTNIKEIADTLRLTLEDRINSIDSILKSAITEETERMEVSAEMAKRLMEEQNEAAQLSQQADLIEKMLDENKSADEIFAVIKPQETDTPEMIDSTPDPTPTPVVKPSSERPNFDKISFF